MIRNICDKYREWETDLIREDVQKNAFPYAVLMEHWQGDFNIATLVRNANAFGAKEVFYTGRKHIDKRGTVGTHHYTHVQHLKAPEDIASLASRYTFVGFECNVESKSLYDFEWPENPLLIFGEESCGITQPLLSQCSHVIHIPQYGSVRSINVGTASGIAMNDFVRKFLLKGQTT